jgi:fructan beta-fructosidase
MKKNIFFAIISCLVMQFITTGITGQTSNLNKDEMYRPQIHFSPKAHWINDPNGMVYHKGVYHLFYQHHPYSSVWGPMHWGHATSSNMINWKHEPIAIYPDSIGTIFSGSAVFDKNNTSGFGKNGNAPLVAIFTQHKVEGEKAGRNDFQTQSIAYSNDEGKTWTKYSANPVINNPGIRDFRDPKVIWYGPSEKWIMSLATKDNIVFYSSPDLKNWTKESEFGEGRGAHGGGWECPDLIPLDDNGKQRWVLIVNLNPGAPNGGSGTQYFVGDFNGKAFTSEQTVTRWLDYGPDNYAGITWSNTGNRKILIGWMSNWKYANLVPTVRWKNALTIPRELKLKHIGNDIFLTSQPVTELTRNQLITVTIKNISIKNNLDLIQKTGKIKFPCRININANEIKDFSMIISNDMGGELIIGYDKKQNQYFIDRSKSGTTDFQKDFAARHVAPRLAENNNMNISLIIDVSSVELFADDGLTVMTSIFFPDQSYNKVHLQSPGTTIINKLEYIGLKSTRP